MTPISTGNGDPIARSAGGAVDAAADGPVETTGDGPVAAWLAAGDAAGATDGVAATLDEGRNSPSQTVPARATATTTAMTAMASRDIRGNLHEPHRAR